MFDRETIKQNLSKCIGNVTFQKNDGTLREMQCTLMEEYIPASKSFDDSAKLPRKQNDDILAVWDLEKNNWRSFRLDSITKIDYIGTGV